MCNPAAASLATTAAGSAASAYGSYQAAKAKAEAAKFNAKVGERQAQDALVRGNIRAARIEAKGTRVKASQKAALAANGVDVGFGTALDILTGTDIQVETDAALARYNAEREAYGYRTQAALDRFRAGSQHPLLAGTTTLLNGVPKVARSYYQYQQTRK